MRERSKNSCSRPAQRDSPPALATFESDACHRLLRRCFTTEEWNWLRSEQAFQEKIGQMRKVDQIERVIAFGLHLLCQARRGVVPDWTRVPIEPDQDGGPCSSGPDRN